MCEVLTIETKRCGEEMNVNGILVTMLLQGIQEELKNIVEEVTEV